MDSDDPHYYAVTLKSLLREFPPFFSEYEKCINASTESEYMNIYLSLSEEKESFLVYFSIFISMMIEESVVKETRMDFQNLMLVFAPGFLFSPIQDYQVVLENQPKETSFLKNMIQFVIDTKTKFSNNPRISIRFNQTYDFFHSKNQSLSEPVSNPLLQKTVEKHKHWVRPEMKDNRPRLNTINTVRSNKSSSQTNLRLISDKEPKHSEDCSSEEEKVIYLGKENSASLLSKIKSSPVEEVIEDNVTLKNSENGSPLEERKELKTSSESLRQSDSSVKNNGWIRSERRETNNWVRPTKKNFNK